MFWRCAVDSGSPVGRRASESRSPRDRSGKRHHSGHCALQTRLWAAFRAAAWRARALHTGGGGRGCRRVEPGTRGGCRVRHAAAPARVRRTGPHTVWVTTPESIRMYAGSLPGRWRGLLRRPVLRPGRSSVTAGVDAGGASASHGVGGCGTIRVGTSGRKS